MSTLFARVERTETSVFAAGQLARRLLADHPDIPTNEIRLGRRFDDPDIAVVQIWADGLAGVQGWARVLGAEVTAKVSDNHKDGTVRLGCVGEVGSVQVRVWDLPRDADAVALAEQQGGDR